jgi:predicted phage terminase large subunit-like protein
MSLQRINSVAAQAKLISDLVHNFHIRKVGIETIAYQQALATQLREDMQNTGNYYMIEEFKPRDRKNERLKNLEYPISQGRLVFPSSKSDQDPIAQTIEQFKAFPRGRHDDGMDAVFYADIISQRPAKTPKTHAIPSAILKEMPNYNKVETNWKVL